MTLGDRLHLSGNLDVRGANSSVASPVVAGLEGKRAIVTGASSGIGLELARIAARDGHDVVLVARSSDRLRAVAEELHREHGVDARPVVADLAEPAGVPTVLDALAGADVDVLVNNAGVGGLGRFATERNLEDDLRMVRLDVESVVHLTGALLPAMVARGRGGILNVSSTAAYAPGPLQAVYYASKAFVKSFSEALTEECRGTGVRVTALCPGPVDTGFAQAAGMEHTPLMHTGPLMVPARGGTDRAARADEPGVKLAARPKPTR